MAEMRNFQAEAAEAVALAKAAEHWAGKWFQHHPATSAAPAAATANIETATPGGTVLPQLEDTVKTDLTQGLDWLEGFVGRVKQAAPGIIATSEAIAGSTAGQLAEIFAGKFLPADIESEFLALAKRYATLAVPVAAAADPQPSFTPAGPQVAGQAQG